MILAARHDIEFLTWLLRIELAEQGDRRRLKRASRAQHVWKDSLIAARVCRDDNWRSGRRENVHYSTVSVAGERARRCFWRPGGFWASTVGINIPSHTVP